MSRRSASTRRALVGIGLLLTLGCSSLLNLDALEKAGCAADGCAGASAGTTSHGGDAAGSSQADVGSAPAWDRGGSAASAGSSGASASAGAANAGIGSGGGGGSPAAGGGGGGTLPLAGGPTGGAAGEPGVAGCQPSATDQSCDGLNEQCQVTAEDEACAADCAGVFVNGTSYMTCSAASDFDQAEAACQGNGMHLVKIDDALEDETVLGLALGDYVWVGGSNREDLNVFVWMDGTAFYSFVDEVPDVYENFNTAADEPYKDERWPCVEQDADGTWSTWDCAEAQSFVCERY